MDSTLACDEASKTILAPAKINLYLHITGRRADGFHIIDSLFCFPDVGDRLTLTVDDRFSFHVTGPFAAWTPQTHDNLVVRAFQSAAQAAGDPGTYRLILEKNLPVAAGIGGGSSDAGAVLRLAGALWPGLSPTQIYDIGRSLGADVPACITPYPAVVSGIGETLATVSSLPVCWIVLLNDLRPVVTADVFRLYRGLSAPFSVPMPFDTVQPLSLPDLVAGLKHRTNDLTTAAIHVHSDIEKWLRVMSQTPECLLARMSGSGGTVFGLFVNQNTAMQAQDHIMRQYPGLWVRAACLGQRQTYFDRHI